MINIFFVLGRPGAGKSSLCRELKRQHEKTTLHLEVGHLLRTQRQSILKKSEKEGQLVPTEIIVNLLTEEFKKINRQQQQLILIDGFPRSLEQLDGWNKQSELNNQCHRLEGPPIIFFLDCPRDVCIARLTERQRSADDTNEDLIISRLNSFSRDTLPVLSRGERKVYSFDATLSTESLTVLILKKIREEQQQNG